MAHDGARGPGGEMYRAKLELGTSEADAAEICAVLDGHSPAVRRNARGLTEVSIEVDAATLAQAAHRAISLVAHATDHPPVALHVTLDG